MENTTTKLFLTTWDLFVNMLFSKENPDYNKVIENYQKDKKWTKCILGAPTRNSKSMLGEYIINALNKKNKNIYEYRKEEYKIDLVISKKSTYPEKDKLNYFNIDGYYPLNYEILIEHENKIQSCWEEMIKLVHLKALLKVLITYNTAIPFVEFNKSNDKIKNVINDFSSIIKQANLALQEDLRTRYILIIGQRVIREENKTDDFYFYKYIFNTKGEYISLS